MLYILLKLNASLYWINKKSRIKKKRNNSLGKHLNQILRIHPWKLINSRYNKQIRARIFRLKIKWVFRRTQSQKMLRRLKSNKNSYKKREKNRNKKREKKRNWKRKRKNSNKRNSKHKNRKKEKIKKKMNKRKNKKRKVKNKVNKNPANLMINKKKILKYRVNKFLRMRKSQIISLKTKRNRINKWRKNQWKNLSNLNKLKKLKKRRFKRNLKLSKKK